MWVNSKEAAEILGVKYDALMKAVKRAEKRDKKFCSLRPNIISFSYIPGIGGASGKTLRIWIDDDLINHKNSEISQAGEPPLVERITAARLLNFTKGESDAKREFKGASEGYEPKRDSGASSRAGADAQGLCRECLLPRTEGDPFKVRENITGLRKESANLNDTGRDNINDAWAGANESEYADVANSNLGANGANGGLNLNDVGEANLPARGEASDGSYEQNDKRGEASAYSKAYAGDGICQREGNGIRELRLQTGSEESADRGAVKGANHENTDDSRSKQILRQGQVLQDGRNIGQCVLRDERFRKCSSYSAGNEPARSGGGGSLLVGAFAQEKQRGRSAPTPYENEQALEREAIEQGGLNLPAALPLSRAKSEAQIRIELSKTKKGLEAQQKEMILKEYARAKAKGIKVARFIEYVNSNRMYSIKLTPNKLFAWQKAYEAYGIEGLIDGRTSHRQSSIETYGLEEKLIELILASNKRVDAASICQKLNEHLAVKDALDVDLLADVYAKRKTPITVSAVYRYMQKWRDENSLADAVRRYGVDRARGMKQPAIGDMSWNITSINQVVEIDATSLDMICINTTLAKMLGMSEDEAKETQKRFCIISIIDIYSHVRVYQMCESENSLAVQRCLAKYILRYGKPAVIRGDNGKAFLSEAVQSAVRELGIEYHAVTPYSGWKKPFVERNFGVLQSNFTAALAGYIGSCVAERVGLEGLYGKADKRAKKGEKTRLENLMSLEEVTALLDMYAEGTINNTAFGKDKKLPRELYDEKAHEAVYMHEYEVMALVGGIKTVKGGNKKGIQYLGDTYIFSGLFRYSRISFSVNLNDVSQLFVFNEKREFLGMATANKDGVSAEEAKAEVKLFEKELRQAQKRVEQARVAMNKDKVGVIKVAYEHLPHAKYPAPRAANNEAGEMIKTRAQKASNLTKNGHISDEMIANAAKPKQEKRRGGYVESMMKKKVV